MHRVRFDDSAESLLHLVNISVAAQYAVPLRFPPFAIIIKHINQKAARYWTAYIFSLFRQYHNIIILCPFGVHFKDATSNYFIEIYKESRSVHKEVFARNRNVYVFISKAARYV